MKKISSAFTKLMLSKHKSGIGKLSSKKILFLFFINMAFGLISFLWVMSASELLRRAFHRPLLPIWITGAVSSWCLSVATLVIYRFVHRRMRVRSTLRVAIAVIAVSLTYYLLSWVLVVIAAVISSTDWIASLMTLDFLWPMFKSWWLLSWVPLRSPMTFKEAGAELNFSGIALGWDPFISLLTMFFAFRNKDLSDDAVGSEHACSSTLTPTPPSPDAEAPG